jgi:peptidoglycan/xylan/chitin deacetylase (PgdA/CDA1 family)
MFGYIISGLIAISIAGTLYFQPRRVFSAVNSFAPGAVYFTESPNRIALTIDDVPSQHLTDEILDVLNEYGVKATFFCMSNEAEKNPKTMARIINEGHEIGHHMTEDFPSIRFPFEAFKEKFNQAERVLNKFTSAGLHWFRPASALFTQEMRDYAESKGYQIVLGDVFPYDTHVKSPAFATSFIANGVRPGSIIVLHDGKGRGNNTAETLRRVLPKLKEKGLMVGTLSALMPH